jgi:glycogen debranching enzyme
VKYLRRPTPLPKTVLLTSLLAVLLQFPTRAQDNLAVRKFEIVHSPLTITEDVRPRQYLGVIGRAAAWLGYETGEAELWVHPLKLANDFRLAFRIPDYVEPVRGADVARTVDVRPELTTITYSHATFTVRQHILAPLNAPGLLVLLDVQTFRQLEIQVSFNTIFQYAWPGAFGGQYAFWNESENAFVLSESRREHNAMIGSPWATTASAHPAHALPDAPNTFVISVDSARAATEFIPIAIAAGIASRDLIVSVYRSILDEAESLYQEKVKHVTELLERTTSIDTPDDELDKAFLWSKINLDEAFVCNPDLGCGLVAGWGQSGSGTRPGFGWFFGGDAAINSFAMGATGLWQQIAAGLRFLARYQRDDGKIPHEISQSAGRIDWFTDFPYAYYHADTTPYWIVALWRYWRASGDEDLLNELWPSVMGAYGWCRTRDTDGDGIIENGPGNLGAIEVGQLGEGIHQDIYLAGVWIEALEAMTEMATEMGRPQLVAEASDLHTLALSTLNREYWRTDEGHHAFGILKSGGTNDNLTVWPATAASFQLLESEPAERTLVKFAADSISSDWGARILSTGSPLYDPMHYNNGAVWPFVTGFVAWSQYNYRRPWAAYPLVDALKQMTFDWARGRHPELLSGRYYRPLDTAVPQQFFATSMLISPIVSGMLGWVPDAPHRRAKLAPQIPSNWSRFSVDNLKVGSATVGLELIRDEGALEVLLRHSGQRIDLELVLSLPPGARDIRQVSATDNDQTPMEVVESRHDVQVTHFLHLSGEPKTVWLRWNGGLALAPPTAPLRPGQESQGIRILDFGETEDGWSVTLEGETEQRYRIELLGELAYVADGPARVVSDGDVRTLEINFRGDYDRSTETIHLRRAAR